MSDERIALGRWGEQLAVERLQAKGYTILERNVRFRTAELDIVAQDGDVLVFIEVRTRRGTRWGTAAESITWRKRQKLREAALCYLEQRRQQRCVPIRFDVVCVTMADGREDTPQIEHVINAF